FQNLKEKQLLAIDNDTISLTYLGKIFSDEVCMFFVSDRVRQNIQKDERSNEIRICSKHTAICTISPMCDSATVGIPEMFLVFHHTKYGGESGLEGQHPPSHSRKAFVANR